jgi:hypothetical protein
MTDPSDMPDQLDDVDKVDKVDKVDRERVDERARLLPEERRAGSDDAELQAQVVLEDSDERTAHPEAGAETSTQTARR